MSRLNDLTIASLGEGALILVVAAIGLALHMPLVFTSLGPTVYEQIEKPSSPSAKPYNIIAGHFLAMAAGFLALWIAGGWGTPAVAAAGAVTWPRLWASVLAVVLTTATTLAAHASQPASLSTTLLVALGSMQRGRDAVAIVVAIVIVAAVGEPVRRARERMLAQH